MKTLSWAGAFGSLFIFAQTYALSLQNIQVNSALGEPLDAIVRVDAAPGEVLQASCMRAVPNAESGMPAIRGIQLSLSRRLSPGTVRLTTARPVNEPMSEVVVHIDCAGAPAVKRSFLIMLDPRGVMDANANPSNAQNGTTGVVVNVAGQSDGPLVSNPSPTPTRANELITSTDRRINVRSRQVTVFRGAPVDPGSEYVVATGDALSTIAARITGRDYGSVWSWAATIQGANPHAFINGNPNELIAGSKLYVPTALAAGTAGLTVPDNRTSAAAVSPSRYEDRFTTTTQLSASTEGTPASNENPAPESPAEPVAVITRQPAATGAIRAIQPVMVMATSFSGISRERLRQRERGLIQAAPSNLPDFSNGSGSGNAQAANDASTPAGEPVPQDNQTPTQPVVAKPEAIAANNGSRFSWLSALVGIGLLVSTFFAGWWLSRRRTEAELEEQIEARLNEERYRARVRSGRQDVIRAGMGGAGAGIQVTEADRTPIIADTPAEPVAELTEDDLDEVVDAALKDDRILTEDDAVDMNAAEPITDNEGPMIDPADLELDADESHELADIDLELLERDYAAQTETNTGLEEIAAAGRGKDFSAADAETRMEFPEDVKLQRESGPAFDTLEFDPRDGSIDFDIGSDVTDADHDKTEALGLDLEEAGATIDAHLEQLQREDEERETGSLDATSEVEMQDFSGEIDDLIIENLIDDEDMQPDSADAEDFYHLEASSIMNVGELDFEKGPDDETNILRFRQRNIRTGTDDASGDDE